MHGFTSNDVKKVNLEVRKGILMAEALFTSRPTMYNVKKKLI